MRNTVPRRAFVEALETRTLLTAYYISPLGSDLNKGNSPNSPWLTFTNVNAQVWGG